ncbi:hypothetical protein M6B38_247685 [Iris pallida]|uniref:Uncharacterized protein n=1 Tax=Iris pallida TaxID=29817 RepID=A0AAX6DG50_IRIPA|nr:hypothetical protein M6B38_247685 [Iris pallida]
MTEPHPLPRSRRRLRSIQSLEISPHRRSSIARATASRSDLETRPRHSSRRVQNCSVGDSRRTDSTVASHRRRSCHRHQELPGVRRYLQPSSTPSTDTAASQRSLPPPSGDLDRHV